MGYQDRYQVPSNTSVAHLLLLLPRLDLDLFLWHHTALHVSLLALEFLDSGMYL